MLADVKLDQENNTNIQIRLLQMKHEFDEVGFQFNSLLSYLQYFQRLRNVENRYKSEIEDLTRRYEQIKSDKELFEKRFHEVLKNFIELIHRVFFLLRKMNCV